ncbi:YcxB family protein [Andreprevotia chitinilytica]|uniref:YcxB family protein n=1 Tax=Andreprevotia chitinilytica TaxID=396808 RepID=UPI000551A645|nr:YcxB family protein [Andreprevotia chitinilytica]
MQSDVATLDTIEINLTPKLLRKANLQVAFERHKWLPFALVMPWVAICASICALIWAATSMMSIEWRSRTAFRAISAALDQPEIGQLQALPAYRHLIASIADLANTGFVDALGRNTLLIEFGATLPMLVLLAARLAKRTQQGVQPHKLAVRFDAEGLHVLRGNSHNIHPWSAIESVVLRQPPGRLPGFVLVHLEFGYTYLWPESAFASREQWLYTGHQLTALHLASRMPLVKSASE